MNFNLISFCWKLKYTLKNLEYKRKMYKIEISKGDIYFDATLEKDYCITSDIKFVDDGLDKLHKLYRFFHLYIINTF